MAARTMQYNEKQSKMQQNDDQTPSVKSSDYVEIINQKQFLDYFKAIKISSVSQKKSDFYAYERFINVTQQIYNGDTQLKDDPEDINHLLVRQKITQQEQKSNQLKNKKLEILNQLALLDNQLTKSGIKRGQSINKVNDSKSFSMDSSRLNSADNQEQNDHLISDKPGKLILSRQEHKQLVAKIFKQREQRQRKRLLLRKQDDQKLKKLEQQQKQLQLKRFQDQKRRKAEQIEQKLKKKKEIHQKFIEQEKESQKKVKQLKHKKFLHQQIQQRFQLRVKMPLLQEQKKLLKQKRQFAKAYSIDQIKSHQKSYLQLRQNSMQKSQAKQLPKSTEQTYSKPAKSSKLEKILQEQKLQFKKQLLQKKMAIQQKLQRQQNYVQFLKQRFTKIKIDHTKQEQIKSRMQKLTTRRQQFDSRAIGINYLQQAKKLGKKTDRSSIEIQKQQNSRQDKVDVTALTNSKKDKQKQSRISQQIRKNSLLKKRQQTIQTLIHDKTSNQIERIKKLKLQTQKINDAFKMKQEMLKYGYSQKIQDEAVQLLLTSIQAKMGIIDISK